jgi:tetratricopeptide (TPR) repeat protein
LTPSRALLLALALTAAGGAAWAQSAPRSPLTRPPAGAAPAGGPTSPAGRGDAPSEAAPSLLALRALLQDARQLLQRNDPGAAYLLLEPHTGAYAGAEDFNYLLGIAALDSGRPSQAVLALERVLANNPEHTLARAEIGRAFLALRETEAARREFQTVARAELPPEVRDTVSRYLEIIARAEGKPGKRWSAVLDAQVGYDSNVNFGSSLDRWVLDDGQALTPLASSRPQGSAFHEVSGQFQYSAPINGNTDWTIGTQLNQRINPSQHNSDLGSVEVSGGLARTQGPNRYSMSVQLQQLYLDRQSFRQAKGLLGQWQRDLDARTQAGAYVQLFALDFPDQPIRDARRSVAGATLVRGLEDSAKTVVVGNAYIGRESSRHDIGELSFGLRGLRAAVSRNLGADWRGSAGVSYERRSHDGPDGFFGITREDRQTEFRLGAERELTPTLTITPQIVFTRNASTLAPSDFRRTQAAVAVRYRF